MLAKFSVSNFKSFNKEFCFDLKDVNGYAFNKDSIKNSIVNHALIYGHNGVGKSNFGFAIFDIIGHITDKETHESQYSYYLNAFSDSETAIFRYEFELNSKKVIYEYEKTNHKTIIAEKFIIDGEEKASIDRRISNESKINFKGTENLNRVLTNYNLSLLKYIKNNSQLEENCDNSCFISFFNFIDGMLFFRSLQNNMYLGFESGVKRIVEDIIEKQNVNDFENFLNSAGIDCKLVVVNEFDEDALAFDFNGKVIPFYRIASQGTQALTLFYYWFQRLREESNVSFLFIDEFDAFYHHELSALVVKKLKETGVQFVLSTHNTSIITNDLLRPDCYFLINNKEIKSLSKRTSKELREAHNIEKMYKANFFNAK